MRHLGSLLRVATTDTIDPAEVVESYVDATGGGGEAAGFPWPLAIGFVLVMIAVFILTIVVRRRLR